MMTVDEGRLALFSEALVQEIWTEMGRNRITSIRALALKMGRNHQYVTARLKVDPKTGKPVPINVVDLYAFADALGVSPVTLVESAEQAVDFAVRNADGEVTQVMEVKTTPAKKATAQEAERARSDALARKRQTRSERRNDYSSFEGSDQAARDEDREKPRID